MSYDAASNKRIEALLERIAVALERSVPPLPTFDDEPLNPDGAHWGTPDTTTTPEPGRTPVTRLRGDSWYRTGSGGSSVVTRTLPA